MDREAWNATTPPRFIAFYLPQFHAIPENDEWWGAGFTEWTNVRRATPLFPGHYQPHVPGELGYYDLLDAGVRRRQSDLALAHGIDGFCYYHYWFSGRRLLEQPFDAVRSTGEPEIPFCLCWANEDWSRRWDGSSRSVLVKQTYSPEDDRAHIRWLIGAFGDRRYIRHHGRPLFLVYRASRLPNARATAETWRRECVAAGIGDPFLVSVESFRQEHVAPSTLGFDASVGFQPDWTRVGPGMARRLLQAAGKRLGLAGIVEPHFTRVAYEDVMAGALRELAAEAQSPRVGGEVGFPCVMPGWDNTPRRQRGVIAVDGPSPERYQEWLEAAARGSELVFVNAWNEWGEGCHLEPDQRFGRAFLEAHKSAVSAIAEGRAVGPRG